MNDDNFKPSFSLKKLIEENVTLQGQEAKLEFKLNEKYKRIPKQQQDNEVKEQREQTDFSTLLGMTKEVQQIKDIKEKAMKRQSSEIYKKYQIFIEQEKQMISSERPIQQIQIEEEEDEEQIPIQTSYRQVDLEELDKLMKINQIIDSENEQNESLIDMIMKSDVEPFILQLPPLLPYEQVTKDIEGPYQVKNIDDTQELIKDYFLNDQYDSSGFQLHRSYKEFINQQALKVPESQEEYGIRLGKVIIKDGKAQMVVGDVQFELFNGIQTIQNQELIRIDIENKKMQQLGEIKNKIIAKAKVI